MKPVDLCRLLKPFSFYQPKATLRVALAAGSFLALLVGVGGIGAFELSWAGDLPAIDYDKMLKPLVDTNTSSSSSSPEAYHPVSDTVLHGEAQHQSSTASTRTTAPKVLTGGVQTLHQAIESERYIVDWYAWYLRARTYLSRTGGLQCPLGTPVKFYKNGRMEGLSQDPVCKISVGSRFFPLPVETRLDAIILPVRPGSYPPASPDELYSRIPED